MLHKLHGVDDGSIFVWVKTWAAKANNARRLLFLNRLDLRHQDDFMHFKVRALNWAVGNYQIIFTTMRVLVCTGLSCKEIPVDRTYYDYRVVKLFL